MLKQQNKGRENDLEVMHDAARNNDVATLRAVLDGGGCDVDEVDANRMTALYLAANRGATECVRMLLKAGARVNLSDRDWKTPLDVAAYRGFVDIVALLIHHKADLNHLTHSGDTALHRAGNEDCMKMLITARAPVDVKNKNGITPLAIAIVNQKRMCAEVLLDAGAKISALPPGTEIPPWLLGGFTKRQNVTRALLTFIGVLKKRFAVRGMEYNGNRLPRELVSMLVICIWKTRLNDKWIGGADGGAGGRKQGCYLM